MKNNNNTAYVLQLKKLHKQAMAIFREVENFDGLSPKTKQLKKLHAQS